MGNLIENLSKFYPRILCLMFLPLWIMMLWHWHGIWSVYLTEVGDNTYIACRYCPPYATNIVQLQEPNTSLKEILLEDMADGRMEVVNYPYDFRPSQTVYRKDVKGIILFHNRSLESPGSENQSSSDNFYSTVIALIFWVFFCQIVSQEQQFWWRVIMTFSAIFLLVWIFLPTIV